MHIVVWLLVQMVVCGGVGILVYPYLGNLMVAICYWSFCLLFGFDGTTFAMNKGWIK